MTIILAIGQEKRRRVVTLYGVMCRATWKCWQPPRLPVRRQGRKIYVQQFTEVYQLNINKKIPLHLSFVTLLSLAILLDVITFRDETWTQYGSWVFSNRMDKNMLPQQTSTFYQSNLSLCLIWYLVFAGMLRSVDWYLVSASDVSGKPTGSTFKDPCNLLHKYVGYTIIFITRSFFKVTDKCTLMHTLFAFTFCLYENSHCYMECSIFILPDLHIFPLTLYFPPIQRGSDSLANIFLIRLPLNTSTS